MFFHILLVVAVWFRNINVKTPVINLDYQMSNFSIAQFFEGYPLSILRI
ncbi:MAG: hypothetical protein HC817_06655 [Saprospiraceae bacterium]|nr:hypothetical protein [Saprospiraceae bacterium]